MAKILLVEDDTKYANLIRDCLAAQKYEVELTSTIDEAMGFVDVYQFDLLIIDWHLPDAEGPTFIKSLREKGLQTPVMMLTGRDALPDKEQGFVSGADDYLSKKVDPRELVMRVQALLRRPAVYKPDLAKVRNIEIDFSKHSVAKDGKSVHLLPKEFAVLAHMVRHPNRVFTAEELLERLWPSDSEATIHTVRSCVNKIRTKLDDPDGPSLIETKYKAGYQLNTEPS